MEKFGHFSVHLKHALPGIGRIVKRGNNIARMGYFVCIGCENSVARGKLAGMDERFAVKTHLRSLPAFGLKRHRVSNIIEHTVQNI